MVSGKKILVILLVIIFALIFLSTSVFASKSSRSGSSVSLSAAAVGSPISFTFMVLPQSIRLGSAHNELRLAASLAPAYNVAGAQIIAHRVKGKVYFHYSSALKKFMKSLSLAKEDFKPLETYLQCQLKKGKKNLLPFVTILATYFETGKAPVFTLSFSQ